jgi:hypothetical protein
MRVHRVTPLGAVIRGALAGATGTAVMDGIGYARARRDGETASFASWETAEGVRDWEGAPAPGQVGRRLAEGFLHRRLPAAQARTMTNAVHWGTGVAWGSALGILAGTVRLPVVLGGIAFGSAVWAASYGTLVPAGIYRPMREYDRAALWKDWSGHAAFGITAAAVVAALGGRR